MCALQGCTTKNYLLFMSSEFFGSKRGEQLPCLVQSRWRTDDVFCYRLLVVVVLVQSFHLCFKAGLEVAEMSLFRSTSLWFTRNTLETFFSTDQCTNLPRASVACEPKRGGEEFCWR